MRMQLGSRGAAPQHSSLLECIRLKVLLLGFLLYSSQAWLAHPPSMGLPDPLNTRPSMSRDTGIFKTCANKLRGCVSCRTESNLPASAGLLEASSAALRAPLHLNLT